MATGASKLWGSTTKGHQEMLFGSAGSPRRRCRPCCLLPVPFLQQEDTLSGGFNPLLAVRLNEQQLIIRYSPLSS